jgi:hypothetical protein
MAGLITLLNFNLGHYMNGIVEMDSTSVATVVIGRSGVVAFNVVVVLVYGAFIGTLVWKRKSELRPRSL